jgi:hypothetical protein
VQIQQCSEKLGVEVCSASAGSYPFIFFFIFFNLLIFSFCSSEDQA